MRQGVALYLVLIVAAVARAGAVVAESSREPGSGSRQLLQNQQYLWPRDSAAISATRDNIQNLIELGNGPAEGLKTAARGLEIARLASNKAVDPVEFDRPAVAAPARPSRNPIGRRLLQQQQQ